jgi:hypothetical protein
MDINKDSPTCNGRKWGNMAKAQFTRRDLIVGIPLALFLNGLAGVSLDFSRALYVQLYATFIFSCCYWVLWEEYRNFPEVHDRKSPLADALLLVASAEGLIHILKAGTDLTKVCWGLDLFLVPAVLWQFNTMRINKYFEHDSSGWISWIRPLHPLSLFGTPIEILHRDEYRYWLLGDGAQVAIITGVLLLYPSFFNTSTAFYVIVIGGSLGEIYNVWRYVIVMRRCKRRKASANC